MNLDIKRIEKRTLFLLLLSFIIITFFLISPFIYINIRNSTYKRTDSKYDFLNSNYVQYNGGKEAQIFFEEFADVEENKGISFKYRDKDKAITLKSATHTVFALDIKYSSKNYYHHKNNVWKDTDMPNINEKMNYYDSFLLTTVMLDKDVYNDNYCGIFFDDNDYIIRYIFIYDVKRNDVREDEIKGIIRSSISLDWGNE